MLRVLPAALPATLYPNFGRPCDSVTASCLAACCLLPRKAACAPRPTVSTLTLLLPPLPLLPAPLPLLLPLVLPHSAVPPPRCTSSAEESPASSRACAATASGRHALRATACARASTTGEPDCGVWASAGLGLRGLVTCARPSLGLSMVLATLHSLVHRIDPAQGCLHWRQLVSAACAAGMQDGAATFTCQQQLVSYCVHVT
jgi:hypothetical protein